MKLHKAKQIIKIVNITLEINVPKDVFKTGLNIVGDILSNHGFDYGAAGGAAVSAVDKAASGLPPSQKYLLPVEQQ
jgi:hypothetical protein